MPNAELLRKCRHRTLFRPSYPFVRLCVRLYVCVFFFGVLTIFLFNIYMYASFENYHHARGHFKNRFYPTHRINLVKLHSGVYSHFQL